jgi:anti-sigma-K factor RskA
MTIFDPVKRALAAGFVTETLSPEEAVEVEALLLADKDFASLVEVFRQELHAEGDSPLPDRVWEGIGKRLTDRRN